MPHLFTYTIPVDDGAAPNSFHGMREASEDGTLATT